VTAAPPPAAATGSSPDWVPPVEERDVVLAGHRVADLASLLAADAVPAAAGEPVPPLWHWASLAQWPRPEEIGPDGHRRQDPCLPQLPETPRRMFAGGSIDFLAPLQIGAVCRVRRQVVDIQRKQGRSGPLVLVTVEIRISDAAGALQLVERQQLVYRPEPPAAARPVPSTPQRGAGVPPLERRADGHWDLHTDPVLLARFSAATANTHRIHYDAPYACGVEGYPGLLVHGPLLAVTLAEVFRRTRPEATVRRFTFRAQQPLFCDDPASLELVEGAGTTSLRATRRLPGQDPVVLMTVEVDSD
jgi:3-methylfumaryl-CoA hydratase